MTPSIAPPMTRSPTTVTTWEAPSAGNVLSVAVLNEPGKVSCKVSVVVAPASADGAHAFIWRLADHRASQQAERGAAESAAHMGDSDDGEVLAGG